jgi:hypothetical protein
MLLDGIESQYIRTPDFGIINADCAVADVMSTKSQEGRGWQRKGIDEVVVVGSYWVCRASLHICKGVRRVSGQAGLATTKTKPSRKTS